MSEQSKSVTVASVGVVRAWESLPGRLPDVPGLHDLNQAMIRLREALAEQGTCS